MKIITAIKHSMLLALVLGMAVGCASTPKQEEEPQAMTAPSVAEAQAAIDAAKAAIAEAKAEGALWRDTTEILKQAEEALKNGDTALAIEFANRARRQAEIALQQKRSERERMAQMQEKAASNYTVMRGDSLWGISGKSDVYGNPYKWPLIYKANRDKIRDADLIYPGQQFTIKQDWSSAEADAAINHARNRGSWSLGVVEESDRAYLAR